jgi:hypothetical protein
MRKSVVQRDIGMIQWGIRTIINWHAFQIMDQELKLFEAFGTSSYLNLSF